MFGDWTILPRRFWSQGLGIRTRSLTQLGVDFIGRERESGQEEGPFTSRRPQLEGV